MVYSWLSVSMDPASIDANKEDQKYFLKKFQEVLKGKS